MAPRAKLCERRLACFMRTVSRAAAVSSDLTAPAELAQEATVKLCPGSSDNDGPLCAG